LLIEGTIIKVLAHYHVKVPQPGNSERTFSVFESSCHLLFTSLTTQR